METGDGPRAAEPRGGPPVPRVLRAVEFYSGIGGFHAGLAKTGRPYTVVSAHDMNEHANAVYAHNFPGVQVDARNVGFLRPAELAAARADLWMLAPPCQPYSRKGARLQSRDARAESFLKLLDAIAVMSVWEDRWRQQQQQQQAAGAQESAAYAPAVEIPEDLAVPDAPPDAEHIAPPRYLIVENVFGFERSDTFTYMDARLRAAGYVWQAFETNPLALGVPYSRPRVFVLARKRDAPASPRWDASLDYTVVPAARVPALLRGTDEPPVSQTLAAFLDHPVPSDGEPVVFVAEKDLWAAAKHFDFVGPQSVRSCCFTKGYGSYARGGGSVVRTDVAPGWEDHEREAMRRYNELLTQYNAAAVRAGSSSGGGGDAGDDDAGDTLEDSEEVSQGTMDSPPADDGPASQDVADADGAPQMQDPARPPLYGHRRQPRTRQNKRKAAAAAKPAARWWHRLGECPLAPLGLRYFTAREMARLHGFADSFEFPASTTTLQRFRLVGNSLHADVARMLLDILLP
ncbi:hypothetical protein HK105_205869 [Polyrhizophydium stewartii]|uniref:DNA (cytosine-5-)-methyltransferase n=1 Tax=Polyrhizophydium stewartii TaxID=2732419 RepID=A0ABR4N4S2_9FUNG|nr:C-5 cytosine-specific DNA methylase [Polyrhizophydium stewartii]